MALIMKIMVTLMVLVAMMITKIQEAKKRQGLFEKEDWARVESSYPKLASLVLNQAITDCN